MTTHRKPAAVFIFVTLALAIMGVGLIIPVLPDLVKEFEGGSTSDASHTYGWMVGSFALMQFICSPILGSLSDKFGRRRVILISLSGSAVDYVLMALSTSVAWLFVARVVAGMTAGIIATTNAYIADVTPPEGRAKAFGLIGAAFGLGLILGPLLGGFLGGFGTKVPFWAAAGLVAVNAIYGFFVLPESLAPEHRKPFSWKRANPVGSLLALRRFPSVFSLAGSHFLLSFAQVMLQAVWVLYMGYRYGWSSLQIGVSFAYVGILSAAVQAGLVRVVTRRIGEKRAFIISICIGACAIAGYGLATEGWMIYVIMVFGALAGVGGPALQSYITRHVPPNEQGALQGAFSSLLSLAGFIGPPVAAWTFGWVIDPDSSYRLPGLPFFEAALCMLIALVFAVRGFHRNDAITPVAAPAQSG